MVKAPDKWPPPPEPRRYPAFDSELLTEREREILAELTKHDSKPMVRHTAEANSGGTHYEWHTLDHAPLVIELLTTICHYRRRCGRIPDCQ